LELNKKRKVKIEEKIEEEGGREKLTSPSCDNSHTTNYVSRGDYK
jgi:hypothetical protein